MEVDYSTNPTRLYESIQSSDWTSASRAIRLYPNEASTWVVRRDDKDPSLTVWRFLPLHSALARNPPRRFIEELIRAYPGALGERDVSGMLPLHYASGNRCALEIMEMLLLGGEEGEERGFGESVWEVDGNGMTALHYVGAYGCSERGVVDLMLSVAAQHGDVRELIERKDSAGMTPLMLAKQAEYEGKEEVVISLEDGLRNPYGSSERDNTVELQVITAQSPRNHSVPRNARSSPGRGHRGFSPAREEISTDNGHKEKHNFHQVISPRHSNSSQSGEYPIHMMDSRSPMHSPGAGMHLTTSHDTDARNDDPVASTGRRSFTIKTRSLGSPLHSSSTPHSTTPTMSNVKVFESSNPNNIKTPRSSGKGGRFGFDHPPPSPRYPTTSASSSTALTSPRTITSPIARGLSARSPRASSPPNNNSDLIAEVQRLQLENETLLLQQQQREAPHHSTSASDQLQILQMQNESLKLQSQQKDAEIASLKSKIIQYEKLTNNTHTIQSHLQLLLSQLAQREQSLNQIMQLIESRENSRIEMSTLRKQELLKLLAAEEEEKRKEGSMTYEGMAIGMAFGRELRGLEEVRGEVGRLLEGLND